MSIASRSSRTTARAIGEDYTLALAARVVLSQRPGTVVTNLSTSRIVDDVAARAGSRVVRAPVGEVNVAIRMREEHAVVGGEGNGGVILPGLHLGRDAPLAAALVLQLLSDGEQTLSQIVSGYPRYAIVKDKLDRPPVALDAVYNALRSSFSDAQVDTQDGLRLSWPDSWVHIRPSGTEPIVRVIAEAPSVDAARALVARSREPLDALAGSITLAQRTMCGIVGYIGTRVATPAPHRWTEAPRVSRLRFGGRRDHERQGRRDAEGRREDLAAREPSFRRTPCTGSIGIAHTRWATHGAPTEGNAHPHMCCKGQIAVVHNGIIENATALRQTLEERGHEFVVRNRHRSHRAPDRRALRRNLEEAVIQALLKIEGTYGIAVISSADPKKIVAARKGSPLLVGLGRRRVLRRQRRVGDPRAHARGRLPG